ncbi:hypothetical protein [Frigoribacterium salinisoli]
MDVSWELDGWPWFALALVNAGLAEQKGRSRLVWFLVSVLLGPIATLLIVVWPRVDVQAGPEDVEPSWDLRFLAAVGTLLVAGVLWLVGASTGGWGWALAASIAGGAALGLGIWAYVEGRRRRRRREVRGGGDASPPAGPPAP